MRGATLRGYVTPDGEVLLQWPAPVPGWEGAWLGDVLRQLGGHDVTICLRDNGEGRPPWVGPRVRALAGPRPPLGPRALGPGGA